MRSLLVKIISTMASFYATSYMIQGFKIDPNWQAYLVSAIVFLLFNLVVSPVVKLLLLPINLLTLGLFRWISQVIVLYLFDVIYTGITITGYSFAGISNSLFAIPSGQLSDFFAYILSALVLSLSYSLVSTLLNGES